MEFKFFGFSIIMKLLLLFLFVVLNCFSCSNNNPKPKYLKEFSASKKGNTHKRIINSATKTIHVFVALCDNKYQGIIPVGKAIGNGQDPDNNLYWGCDNGLKTYFRKKNSNWILIQTQRKISDTILERLLFKHKTKNVYLLADAYNGKFIKQTTIDFLEAAAGKNSLEYIFENDTLYFGGSSNLISYVGHDGLMDFRLPIQQISSDTSKRETIILACFSQYFFSPHIQNSRAIPLLWTTNLMAPEAYTLHDALREWIANKNPEQVRLAAAQAYSKFQKCSLKAAKNLLVSGW